MKILTCTCITYGYVYGPSLVFLLWFWALCCYCVLCCRYILSKFIRYLSTMHWDALVDGDVILAMVVNIFQFTKIAVIQVQFDTLSKSNKDNYSGIVISIILRRRGNA